MSYKRMCEEERRLAEQVAGWLEEAEAQRNFTDPDSRIMREKGTYVQAYNCQAAVDIDHQIIVAADITQRQTDWHMLDPVLAQLKKNCGRQARKVSADAGYCSEDNLAMLRIAQPSEADEGHGLSRDSSAIAQELMQQALLIYQAGPVSAPWAEYGVGLLALRRSLSPAPQPRSQPSSPTQIPNPDPARLVPWPADSERGPCPDRNPSDRPKRRTNAPEPDRRTLAGDSLH